MREARCLMNSIALRRQTSIHLLVVLSFVCSLFVMPTPANAGVLSKVWSFVRPAVKIAGHVGGAIAGATMASAIVPPLGTIVGGVAGWIVGGMIADYSTKSLSNLAAVGAGVAGAIALGPSAIGIVGGFLLGGLVGKLAFSLLKKADCEVTGGVLLNQGQAAQAPSMSVSSQVGEVKTDMNNGMQKVVNTVKEKVNIVTEKAKDTKANLIREAQEKYEQASKAYREAVEKAQGSEVVRKAKQVMDAAKNGLQQLLRK